MTKNGKCLGVGKNDPGFSSVTPHLSVPQLAATRHSVSDFGVTGVTAAMSSDFLSILADLLFDPP